MLQHKTGAQLGDALFTISPDSDVVGLKLGDKTTNINKKELYSLIWAMADEKQQEAMLPMRQTEVMEFVKHHKVMAKKDIRKGEMISMRCRISVPLMVVEGLKGMLTKSEQSKFAP